MSHEDPVHTMTEAECWDFLRSQEFGRLAFHLADRVQITPVNYCVDNDTLLFRTAEGDKLLGVVMNPDVAFEIDEYDETHARSVILHGRARKLEEDEEHRDENLPLRPWLPTLKYNLVEIAVSELSGRYFELERPWLHIRVAD